ncbi:MAG: hypothetical protein VW008_00005, partial [Aquiluna sp.]
MSESVNSDGDISNLFGSSSEEDENEHHRSSHTSPERQGLGVSMADEDSLNANDEIDDVHACGGDVPSGEKQDDSMHVDGLGADEHAEGVGVGDDNPRGDEATGEEEDDDDVEFVDDEEADGRAYDQVAANGEGWVAGDVPMQDPPIVHLDPDPSDHTSNTEHLESVVFGPAPEDESSGDEADLDSAAQLLLGSTAIQDDDLDTPNQAQDVTSKPRFVPNRTAQGKKIHAIPPRLSLGDSTGWKSFDGSINGRFRPKRVLFLNLPIDLFNDNSEFLRSFCENTDPSLVKRSVSAAALLGLFSLPSRGYYFEGRGFSCEKDLPDDEKARAAALKTLHATYFYKHQYYAKGHLFSGQMLQDDPDTKQKPFYGAKRSSDRAFSYEAHSFSFAIEKLFNPQGDVVGVRLLMLVWNEHFSLADFQKRAIQEHCEMARSMRVSTLSNAKRQTNISSMAKTQRGLIASGRMDCAAAKVGRFCCVGDVYNACNIVAKGGRDQIGSAKRPFYKSDAWIDNAALTCLPEWNPGLGTDHAL